MRRRWLQALMAGAAIGMGVLSAGTPSWAASTTYYTDRVAVLMYHQFNEPKDSPYMVTAEQFEQHLQVLKEAGFQFITPQQFRNWKAGKGSIPANAVLVTIDDGLKEIRSVAMPILRKHQVGAVAFVVYHRIDRAANTLTSQDLQELIQNGIDVQSHSYNIHYRVVPPGQSQDVAAVVVLGEEEIRQDTQKALEAHRTLLGTDPDMLAYPYGIYTPTYIRISQEAGIRYAFTTREDLVARSTPDMELPRINAGRPTMSAQRLVETILKYVPKPAPNPTGYFVGGGLYRTKEEAAKAAAHFARLTGYRMYVTGHPTHDGYWVQTGRISTRAQADALARKWARLGIRYVVAAGSPPSPSQPALKPPANNPPTAAQPAGFFVGGGLYRTKEEAAKAAAHFARLTGYRMYVTGHPTHDGYWVQTGRISTRAQADALAKKWARLGIRYVVAAGSAPAQSQPAPKPPANHPPTAPRPAGFFVGGGLYRTTAEAAAAAEKFTRLTGYRLYVVKHPTLDGYWVQTGRISTRQQAQALAHRWERWGIRYVVAAG